MCAHAHAGGACLLSRTHRGLMHGVEMADSFAWNPHKMMVRLRPWPYWRYLSVHACKRLAAVQAVAGICARSLTC